MKFEENIKEKLEARKIKPSAAAWNRISEDLDEEQPKNQKPKWPWVTVAASIVGILFLATNFFGPNLSNNKKNNQIVTVPTKQDSSEKEVVPDERVVQDGTVMKHENEDRSSGERGSGVDSKVIGKIENTNMAEDFLKRDKGLAETGKTDEEGSKTVQKPSKATEKFKDPNLNRSIDREVEALLATVDSLRKNDQQVTEADVDALLAQAQQKLLIDQEFSKGAENLSAEALLRETESEIDRSFRDKIFDALKEGYFATREALASRNN